MAFNADRAINGTFGEVYVDDEKIAEVVAVNGKLELQYEDVPQAGILGKPRKMVSVSGKGSIKFTHVTTRFAAKIAQAIKENRTPRFEVMSKLHDPSAYGYETVWFHDCTFDDLTAADWEVSKIGTVEAPFAFTSCEYVDKIDAVVQ